MLDRVHSTKIMKKIFVNGTFDIIHIGHLDLLHYAKSLGDYLLVAIDTDMRVREKKGPTRPINNGIERKYLLESLKPVDEVRFFGSDSDLIYILEEYKPNIIVKGDDHKKTEHTGISNKYCNNVIYYERIAHYSTTKKIQDIINRR